MLGYFFVFLRFAISLRLLKTQFWLAEINQKNFSTFNLQEEKFSAITIEANFDFQNSILQKTKAVLSFVLSLGKNLDYHLNMIPEYPVLVINENQLMRLWIARLSISILNVSFQWWLRKGLFTSVQYRLMQK